MCRHYEAMKRHNLLPRSLLRCHFSELQYFEKILEI